MPHDMHGRKIDLGDYVKTKPYNQKGNPAVVGRVVSMTTCTGEVVWPDLGGNSRDYFGADESELILKADGSDPQPAAPPPSA